MACKIESSRDQISGFKPDGQKSNRVQQKQSSADEIAKFKIRIAEAYKKLLDNQEIDYLIIEGHKKIVRNEAVEKYRLKPISRYTEDTNFTICK